MAEQSAIRSSRRATSRRNVIVQDEDDEVGETMDDFQEVESEGEEFTPAPKRSPKKVATTVRRRTAKADVDATPVPKTSRSRRTRVPNTVAEPTELFDPEVTINSPPSSPSRRGQSRRSRVTSSTNSRSLPSAVKDPATLLPTPEPSVTPEPASSPLSDITAKANNGQTVPPTPATVGTIKMKPMETVFEKPMDIVVRTRALGIPQSKEPEAPKARMVIKYLNLTNFKSYAGRQEVGPFHASFSSVVGPNGSGKSNVIDSLLFVFGFRASKMRQGKISALIHNSAAYPSLDFCEVEVVFEEVMDSPGCKHEFIPDSTLIISRKAYKNNASDYLINGQKSSFTAVTTLLREKGVDLDHKRFLILQGEVESIAQMKPKAQSDHDDGLLEYLEDIIGTSRYKAPIDEAIAETETLNELCKEKSSRVQLVEKEKRSLEDKKSKALAYVRDENDLTFKKSALYQLYQAECEDNLQVTKEAVTQMQAQLDEELGRHEGGEGIIKELEKSFNKGQKDYETLGKDTQGVLKEMARCEKERVKFEERKKFIINKQRKLEKTLHTSNLSASEASGLIAKYQDDAIRRSQEIIELETQMHTEAEQLAMIRDSLKGRTQVYSDAIAEKQASLEPWNEKISKQQSDKAVAQSELEILQERATSGQKAVSEIKDKITKLQAERDVKIEDLTKASAEKRQLETKSATLQQELADLAQQEPELHSLLSGARQKADESRSSLQSSQSQGNVLNGLTRLKESGRIEGFHGRLGNLGTIEEKYDIAISTACPQLENLVGDSVEVGQQCIDYLRKNNLGRANIICLDRLAKRDLSPIETPENVPRLFDLIQSKHEMFRPAFYSVLQNTLVAKDLSQANRIAYGKRRWRVVTLDGQLIDVSGTLSGGGTRVARGAMSSTVSSDTTKEQVAKYEANRDQLEIRYRALENRRRTVESELKLIAHSLPALETQTQKIRLEVSSLEQTIADANDRLNELSGARDLSNADKASMLRLGKSIAAIDTELTKLHGQTSGVEEEIKELQDKIMEIGGVKLRMQKAKVDGLKEQIDTLGEEVSAAEISKSKAEQDQLKQSKVATQAQKDIDLATEELEHLESEGQELLREASRARRCADEAQTALDGKKDELEDLKRDLEEKTSQLNETRALEIEMRNKLEENQKVFAENEKRLRYWTDKLEKLSIHSLCDLEDREGSAAAELPQFTRDELLDTSKDTLKAEIAALEEKTENASVDLGVLEEYRKRVQEHNARFEDLQSALAARDSAKKRCDELRRLRLEGFMQGFSVISLRLKEMYQMITMGGNAELELVDSLDPFSEGILFSVMPPKKSWKNISNLSGGEKTLSSLALVFALHHYRPTPLYVMDEIDAALDFRNVSIVASYIKERTKNAQFIVISLRNNMFELASRLVGVYKVNHMTKSVTVENKDYIIRRRV